MINQEELSLEEMLRLGEKVEEWASCFCGNVLGTIYYGKVGNYFIVSIREIISDLGMPWIQVDYDDSNLANRAYFREWRTVCIGTSGYCDTANKQERLNKLYAYAKENACNKCSPQQVWSFITSELFHKMRTEGVKKVRENIRVIS